MQECPYCHETTLNPIKKMALRKSMYNTCSNCGETSTYIPHNPFRLAFSTALAFMIAMPIQRHFNPDGDKIIYWAFLFSTSFLIASINAIPRPYVTLEDAEEAKNIDTDEDEVKN